MSREIMQQALTVLKAWDSLIKYQYSGTSEAMTAMQNVAWRTLDTIEGLEQELAKPEQEPVKCTCGYAIGHPLVSSCSCKPRKEWVGLTDTDIETLIYHQGRMLSSLIIETEAKLKEKNGG